MPRARWQGNFGLPLFCTATLLGSSGAVKRNKDPHPSCKSLAEIREHNGWHPQGRVCFPKPQTSGSLGRGATLPHTLQAVKMDCSLQPAVRKFAVRQVIMATPGITPSTITSVRHCHSHLCKMALSGTRTDSNPESFPGF